MTPTTHAESKRADGWTEWRRIEPEERIGAFFCGQISSKTPGGCKRPSAWVSSLGNWGRVVLCDECHASRSLPHSGCAR